MPECAFVRLAAGGGGSGGFIDFASPALHALTHTFGTLIASDTRITRPAAHGDVGAKSVLIITKFQIISSPHN